MRRVLFILKIAIYAIFYLLLSSILQGILLEDLNIMY